MDEFGFGTALLGVLRVLRMTARATGRTRRMIERCSDGDIIIFTNAKEAQRVERLAANQHNKKLHCIVVEELSLGRVPDEPKLRGRQARVHFDHSWIEDYHERKVITTMCDLASVLEQLSRAPATGAVSQDAERSKQVFGLFGPFGV